MCPLQNSVPNNIFIKNETPAQLFFSEFRKIF